MWRAAACAVALTLPSGRPGAHAVSDLPFRAAVAAAAALATTTRRLSGKLPFSVPAIVVSAIADPRTFAAAT
jgi:hypothetical protein